MAHDPTRHWPLGVGPENTSIPGAAWLELLDGQAFPVVGAGAMVWNGTMWVPVSTQNRLPVDAAVSGTVDVSDRADRQLGQVALSGSVAQVLDEERAAGFGGRRYFGQRYSAALGGAGAVPIVGKTVTIWFHNLSSNPTRSGVKLHWFLGGTVHDGIPEMDFGNVPAGSVLGIRIGGSAPDNDQIIHVPRFGGDGVVFSVDIHSGASGNVRTVILEESSYA